MTANVDLPGETGLPTATVTGRQPGHRVAEPDYRRGPARGRTTATRLAPGRHFPRHLEWEAGRPTPVWSRPSLKAPLPGLQAGPPLVWSRPSLKAPLPGLQAGWWGRFAPSALGQRWSPASHRPAMRHP